MSLFPIVDGRARFDASGNVDSDRYSAGIRFTQEGAARSTTSAGTFFNQGIPMSATGQVSVVDASAGLPAGTIYHNGLPMNGDRVCISNKPVAVVSSGIPYDSAGAVAATVAPITNLPTLDLVFAGTATDPLDAASMTDDTLSLNFTSEAYQIAAQYAVWGTGGLQAVNFSDIVTFTRASTATYFDSAGVLQSAAINTARFDYNPSTLALRGLLIEEQRTNGIRNNTMQGAVAGTPGTLPTNWQIVNTGGLSSSVVGFGSESGVSYVDIRAFGTTTAGVFTISPEIGGLIAASNGQTWTASAFLKIVGGSTANILFTELGWSEQNSVPSFLAFNVGIISIPTTGSLAANRVVRTGTNGQATTAFVRPVLNISFDVGVAIDITLRIGLPQLEQGAFATSVIPTTTTALTRSADVASVNTLSPWFNAVEGTLFADLVNITRKAAVDYPRLVSLVGSDANNDEISIYTRTQGPGTGFGYGSVTAGGTNTFDPGNPATTVDAWKAAIAYKTNDTAFACSGLVSATDTSVTLPTCVQLRLFGQARFQLMPSGYLRRVTYYPRRLANADLQTLTA